MALLAITAAIEVGSLIYRLVDRPSTPKPSLLTRQIANAQNGAPIPFGFGTCRFAGQIIWSSGITFVKSTSKKGGPSVVNYTYFASFAVAFCEGPATIGRIWGDSKILYDPDPVASEALDASNYPAWDPTVTYNPGATVSYAGTVWESLTINTGSVPNVHGSTDWVQVGTYPNWDPTVGYNPGDAVTFLQNIWICMNSNNNVPPTSSVWSPHAHPGNDWVEMSRYYPAPTIYPGDFLQSADPTIQAAEGAANVSANRGLCWALFENFPLQNFGSRIPNIRAEVAFKVTPANAFELSPVGGSWGSFDTIPDTSGHSNGLSAVSAGQSIIVQISFGSTVSNPTISDTLGNSYTRLANLGNMAVFFCESSVGNATGAFITVNFGASSTWEMEVSVLPDGVGGAPTASTVTGTGIYASGSIGGIDVGPFLVSTSSVSWSLVMVLLPSNNGGNPNIWPSADFGPAVLAFIRVPDTTTFPNPVVGPDGQNHVNGAGDPEYVAGEWTLIEAGAALLKNMYWVYTPTSSQPEETLADTVSKICLRAGLTSSQVDVSLLTGANIQPSDIVKGYLVEQPRSAAEILKVLMQAFFFDGADSGGAMRWIPRGLASALTIPESDLGLVEDKAKLEESIAQAQDLPQRMTVLYDDPVLDYQQNKQMKLRSAQIVGSTRQDMTLQIPMTMDGNWARQVAEKALYQAWLARSSYKFNVGSPQYMLLDPADVIEFVYEGITFTVRITEDSLGQAFATEISCDYENEIVYLSSAEGGSVQNYTGSDSALVGATQLFLFDIPLVNDTDANLGGTGLYFAAGNVSADWAGAALYTSTDDSTFTPGPVAASAAMFGYATTTLGAPASPWTIDSVNTLTVKFSSGTPAGVSLLDLLAGSNWFMVGSELVGAQNVTDNGDGTFTLSTLLRGLRGTELSCGMHGANERVVSAASLNRNDEALAAVGVPEYYKAVSVGQDPSTAAEQQFTIAGADLKPYAPAGIGGTADGSGNIIITWIRRTRIGGEADWADGVTDVPLSEDAELYDVEILNGSTVVRTISELTTATCVYTQAMQVADFGSTQTSVNVNVYQRSAQVGRGTKATGTAPTPGGWPLPWAPIYPGEQLFYVNGS